MRDPSDNITVLERCGCETCRRAASLDAMRHIEAARASARPPLPDPGGLRRGIANAALPAAAFYALVVAGWLLLHAWSS